MKEDMITRMTMVLNALNNITVKGEENLSNLSGSIGLLKGILDMIQRCDIKPIEVNKGESTQE